MTIYAILRIFHMVKNMQLVYNKHRNIHCCVKGIRLRTCDMQATYSTE